MLTETEQVSNLNRSAEEQFEFCVGELVKAKEKMASDAIESKNPEQIKSALIKLLESNKTLISALDSAYKKLNAAKLNITSGPK